MAEVTSKAVASAAARIMAMTDAELKDYIDFEGGDAIRSIAASALTQAPDNEPDTFEGTIPVEGDDEE